MKSFITFVLSLVFVGAVFAQDGFNFKGLVTDANGNPVSNTSIDVRATIRQGNTTVWDELHNNVQTDQYGIFSIQMGEGTRNGGTATNFNDIDWDNSNMKYLIQVNSGSGFQTLVSNEPFKYVPYAKLANKVNGVQDKINIGASNSRLLYVEGDAVMAELARFKLLNPSAGEDVLNLNMSTDPSAGYAQFIECNVGSSNKFIVDNTGTIFMTGELHTRPDQADMKPYIYGKVSDTGNIISYASTNGFSVTKLGTGHYRITFDNPVGSYNNYMVLVTTSFSANNAAVSYIDGNYFEVFIRNTSTDSYADGWFSFVVFKK